MAFRFNNASSDRVVMTDNAAFTFPDGDWTVAGWVKCTSRSGTSDQRILSYMSGTTKYLVVDVGDPSSAYIPDDLRAQFKDDDGTTLTADSSSNPFASNTSWTHVLIRRGGTTMTVRINDSEVATASNAGFDGLDAGDWKWGNNQYDAKSWKGDMAEWAKWDRDLSAEERTALSKGYAPSFFKNNLKFYMPMVRDYIEVVNNITVTNNGTTVVDHPPIIYPSYTIIGKVGTTTQNVAPPVLSNTPTIYAPTLAKLTYPLTAPLITNSPTIYGPALTPISTLVAPAITNTPTFYAPTLAKLTYNLTAPLVSNAPTFPSATLSATYSLTAPLVTNSPTFHGPTLSKLTYPLQPPVISNTPTFYGPTLVKQVYPLTAPLVTLTPTFPSPTFVPGQVSITAPLLSNAPTFYGITLAHTGTQSMTAPLLTVSQTFYGPTIGYKWVDTNGLTVGEWTDVDFPFYEI